MPKSTKPLIHSLEEFKQVYLGIEPGEKEEPEDYRSVFNGKRAAEDYLRNLKVNKKKKIKVCS